jgi:hypothetical protein
MVKATTENQHSCGPDLLKLKLEQVEDQNHEFSIDEDLTNSQIICYPTSTHIGQETFYDAFTCPSLQSQDRKNKGMPSIIRVMDYTATS